MQWCIKMELSKAQRPNDSSFMGIRDNSWFIGREKYKKLDKGKKVKSSSNSYARFLGGFWVMNPDGGHMAREGNDAIS